MQASPEVRQQHKRFVPAKGKGHHRTGGKEFCGNTKKKSSQEVVAQERKQEPSRKLDTINSHLTFCSKNYHSSVWFEKLLKTSVKNKAMDLNGFSQQQF